MAEAGTSETDWIAAWIEKQRELLRNRSECAAGEAGAASLQDLGSRWLEVGEAYLRGLQHYAQGAAHRPGGTASGESAGDVPFQIGEELLNLWRQAWSGASLAQQSAAQRMSDLFARVPSIGLAREQTEAWRELIAAQVQCQRLEHELSAMLSQVQADALTLLEQRRREQEQANQPLGSYRDLYDLWVECGEQVYAPVAHSEAYCRLQAELGNATMRLRARQQHVIEHGLKQFDLPTRSELNTVHRQLRELRERLAALEPAPVARRAPRPDTRAGARRKTRQAKHSRQPGKARGGRRK